MFLRNNGLSIALLTLFLIFLGGQFATGHRQYNEERVDHGQEELTSAEYLKSDHFLEATMENWESEFLQMFAYVLLTAFLFQKGSSESKDPERERKSAGAAHGSRLGTQKGEPSTPGGRDRPAARFTQMR